jgi:peptidoglycan/xylan/chitin deacetylase (PgdA/CDA1 family)
MTREEQCAALRLAKKDLEDVIEQPVTGYRACYGSANSDTFAICEDLDFTWSSNSSNRYRPEFFANWSGSWRFPHHTSRVSNLICGDMALYEIPVTVGIHVYYDESIRQPLDLRVETPPDVLGNDRGKLRQVLEENIVEMQHRAAPVRTIIGASHNTSLYGDPSTYQSQNLEWTVRHTRELAGAHGLDFTAATFTAMLGEAQRVNAY